MIIKSLATGLALASSMILTNIPNRPVCYKEFHEKKDGIWFQKNVLSPLLELGKNITVDSTLVQNYRF